jgi:hypothetical protein
VDIYALLKADHDQVKELFGRLDEAAGAEERQRLFREIKSALEIHKEAEERTFYAVLSNLPEIADRIEEAMEEHADIEELIEELAALDVANGDFASQIDELREEVEHHVAEEEGEVFPAARKLLDDDQAGKLAEEFRSEKEQLAS